MERLLAIGRLVGGGMAGVLEAWREHGSQGVVVLHLNARRPVRAVGAGVRELNGKPAGWRPGIFLVF